jgi:uncharacterized protein YdbL (DUF1318 family)
MSTESTMRPLPILAAVALTATLAACVTINVYFPAAAAEKAADRIIEDVWGKQPGATEPQPGEPEAALDGRRIMTALADLVVPAAHAQKADIDVSSPTIQRIKASMQARHNRLKPHYDSGAVGLTSDGLVAVRAPGQVPLKERNQVNQLVAEENRDRNALYRQIAQANGHPEWEQQIRDTFAQRWAAQARRGWWYQDPGGRWVQK